MNPGRYRAQLRLAVRIAVASLLAYFICPLAGLTQTYPAVLTAVIVMQASVGASLKAMLDRFLGSLGGALWGVAALLVLHRFSLPSGVVLTLALTPLALIVAFKPAYRAALTATVILLLTPGSAAEPLASAMQRTLGIGLGSVVALMVALVVFPTRAQAALAEAAGLVVLKMSSLVVVLMKGPPESVQQNHDDIRKALAQAEAIADEAVREQAAYVAAGPDPLPLCRALRRLRNDLSMVGRAIAEPLPEAVNEFLGPVISSTAIAISDFMLAMSRAIAGQFASPPMETCDRAFAEFSAAMTALRRVERTRDLPDEAVGRVFGLAFSLEQLHQNLRDLVDRANELVDRDHA